MTILRQGLCSVTFRRLSTVDVVDLAAAAGLETIEWGGDVHVPPGAATTARLVRDESAAAGLRVASYGSYFRAGPHDAEDFHPVLASAVALGAPRIRIWAGAAGSAEVSAAERDAVVRSTRAVCDVAASYGTEIAFEFHRGTLTDSAEATLALLEAVDRPNVSTYWQPPVGMPDGAALAGLELVLDRVSAVHVFSWWPDTQRRRLATRAGLWRSAFAALRRRGALCDALLEFVPDDAPGLLAAEAQSFRDLA